MKWADQAPFPGPDTRDYVAEGQNNIIGLTGLIGSNLTAMPTAIEAVINATNILRNHPMETLPGSFNWLGEQTGLRDHPLYQIGGMGFGNLQNFAARKSLSMVDNAITTAKARRLRELADMASEVYYDNNAPGKFLRAKRRYDYNPIYQIHSAAHNAQRLGRRASGAGLGETGDALLNLGVGGTRAYYNIERERQSPLRQGGAPLPRLTEHERAYKWNKQAIQERRADLDERYLQLRSYEGEGKGPVQFWTQLPPPPTPDPALREWYRRP